MHFHNFLACFLILWFLATILSFTQFAIVTFEWLQKCSSCTCQHHLSNLYSRSQCSDQNLNMKRKINIRQALEGKTCQTVVTKWGPLQRSTCFCIMVEQFFKKHFSLLAIILQSLEQHLLGCSTAACLPRAPRRCIPPMENGWIVISSFPTQIKNKNPDQHDQGSDLLFCRQLLLLTMKLLQNQWWTNWQRPARHYLSWRKVP